MIVTVEISYYPLSGEIDNPVNKFIQEISGKNLSVEMGKMSTMVSGEYAKVMNVLTESMAKLMEEYPSVFNLKISNTCPV